MATYSKYKDRNPRDTVFEIQRILNGAGLFPVLKWIDNSYDGVFSNRITLHPTLLGTNGKGTDELYASASGYAELMERIQNGMLRNVDPRQRYCEEFGFRYHPDEQCRLVSDIVANPDPLTADVLPKMGLTEAMAQKTYLRILSENEGLEGKTLTVAPFVDPAENKVHMVPYLVSWAVTGSNGMAAGNTLEEAMVQALSEVFERRANQLVILGKAVPPQIPEEEIKKYENLYRLVERVKEKGRYHVVLLDCSMGKGWPVAGICISDLKRGTFGIKLGAHPSFAVALERTLTEALQGRATMESFTQTCRMGTAEEASNYVNVPNVEKVGIGVYPASMFVEEPGWDYVPWTRWEGLDNKGFLQEMIRLLKEEGLHPLFRDTSFLGFPSCYVVVPSFSYLEEISPRKRRYITTWHKALKSWDHFPELTEEEAKRLLLLIRYSENSFFENETSFLSCRVFSERYDKDRVGAYLSLKLRQFEDALHFFRRLQSKERDSDESSYLGAMALYAKARCWGYAGEQAQTLVRSRFVQGVAERVCGDVVDLDQVMRRQFPRTRCYDCVHCEAAAAGACTEPVVANVVRQIGRAMSKDNVSQDALLAKLRAMYVE